jgi:hypothetical protein
MFNDSSSPFINVLLSAQRSIAESRVRIDRSKQRILETQRILESLRQIAILDLKWRAETAPGSSQSSKDDFDSKELKGQWEGQD